MLKTCKKKSSHSTWIFAPPKSVQCVLFYLFLVKVLCTVINKHRWAKETSLPSAQAVPLGAPGNRMCPGACLQDVMTPNLPPGWEFSPTTRACPISVWPNDHFSLWGSAFSPGPTPRAVTRLRKCKWPRGTTKIRPKLRVDHQHTTWTKQWVDLCFSFFLH